MANENSNRSSDWKKAVAAAGRGVNNVFAPIMPATTNTAAGVMQSFRDARIAARSVKTVTNRFFGREGKAAQRDSGNLFNSAMRDLQNGTYSLDKANEALYDDYETEISHDFDKPSEDQPEMSTDEIIMQGNKGMAKAIVKGASAQLEGMQSMTAALIGSQLKSSQALSASINGTLNSGFAMINNTLMAQNQKLNAINQNLGAMIEFNNKNTIVYYTKSMEMMNAMGKMLDNMNEHLNPKVQDRRKFDTSNGFNLRDYGQYVLDGIKESTLGAMFGFGPGMMGGGRGGNNKLYGARNMRGGGGLIGGIISSVIPTILPKVLTKALGDFDKTFAAMMDEGLKRIGEIAGNNHILQMLGIADAFGNKRVSRRGINMGAYQKNALPWNGQAQKALVEVIPEYLASIDAKLSGEEKRYYDYDKGKFKSESKIKKETEEEFTNIIRAALQDSITATRESMAASGRGKKDQDKLIAQLSKIIDDGLLGDEKKLSTTRSGMMKEMEAFGLAPKEIARLSLLMQSSLENANEALNDLTTRIESSQHVARNLENKDGRSFTKDHIERNITAHAYKYDTRLIRDIKQFIDNVSSSHGWEEVGLSTDSDTCSLVLSCFNSGISEKEIIEILNDSYQRLRRKKSKSGDDAKWFNAWANRINAAGGKVAKYVDKASSALSALDYKQAMKAGKYESSLPAASAVAIEVEKLQMSGAGKGKSSSKNAIPMRLDVNEEVTKTVTTTIPEYLKEIRDGINRMNAGYSTPGVGSQAINNALGTPKQPRRAKLVRAKAATTFMSEHGTQNVLGGVKDTATRWLENVEGHAKTGYEKVMDKSKSALDTASKVVKDSVDKIRSMPAAQSVEGSIIQANQSVRAAVGSMTSSFQEFTARLFGKEGFFKTFAKEGLDMIMNKFFRDEDAPFHEQYVKVKTSVKEFGNKVRDKVRSGYDYLYDSAMTYLYGFDENGDPIDYKTNEKYQNNTFMSQTINRRWRAEQKELKRKEEEEAKKKAEEEAKTSVNKVEENAAAVAEDVKSPLKVKVRKKKSSNDAAEDKAEALNEAVDETIESAQNMAAQTDAMTSAIAGDSSKTPEQNAKEYKKTFMQKMKDAAPKATVAGAVGAGVGLLNMTHGSLIGSLFLPGGPIGGALVGVGLTLLSQTEGFKDFMFGKKNEQGEREGGLINAELRKSMKKALPSVVGGATVGAITGVLKGAIGMGKGLSFMGMQLLPGGILGGAIIGAGLGLLKHSDKFKDFLFGEKDKDGKRKGKLLSGSYNKVKDVLFKNVGPKVKKGLKGAGAGALTAAVIGHMGALPAMFAVGGPVGGAIAGLAMGIMSGTKRFNEFLFGQEELDENGNPTGKRLKNGLITRFSNMMKVNVIEPMADSFKKNMLNLIDWTKDKITYPFRLAFGPIIDSLKTIKDNVVEFVKDKFEIIGDGITAMLKGVVKTIFSPLTKFMGFITRSAGNLLRIGAQAAMMPAAMILKPLEFLTAGKRFRAKKDFTKEYLFGHKDENGNRVGGLGSNLRDYWAAKKADGEKFGFGRRIADTLEALTGRGELHDEQMAAWAEENKENGYNNLDWMGVAKERRDMHKARRQRNRDDKTEARVAKLRRKVAKELGYREVDLNDTALDYYKKEFGKVGADISGINSSKDLMNLIYHREDYKKGLIVNDPATEQISKDLTNVAEILKDIRENTRKGAKQSIEKHEGETLEEHHMHDQDKLRQRFAKVYKELDKKGMISDEFRHSAKQMGKGRRKGIPILRSVHIPFFTDKRKKKYSINDYLNYIKDPRLQDYMMNELTDENIRDLMTGKMGQQAWDAAMSKGGEKDWLIEYMNRIGITRKSTGRPSIDFGIGDDPLGVGHNIIATDADTGEVVGKKSSSNTPTQTTYDPRQLLTEYVKKGNHSRDEFFNIGSKLNFNKKELGSIYRHYNKQGLFVKGDATDVTAGPTIMAKVASDIEDLVQNVTQIKESSEETKENTKKTTETLENQQEDEVKEKKSWFQKMKTKARNSKLVSAYNKVRDKVRGKKADTDGDGDIDEDDERVGGIKGWLKNFGKGIGNFFKKGFSKVGNFIGSFFKNIFRKLLVGLLVSTAIGTIFPNSSGFLSGGISKIVSKIFGKGKEAIDSLFDKENNPFVKLWNGIKKKAGQLLDALGPVGDAIRKVAGFFGDIGKGIKDRWDTFKKDWLDPKLAEVKKWFEESPLGKFVGLVKQDVSDLAAEIGEKGLLGFIKELPIKFITAFGDNAANLAKGISDNIGPIAESLSKGIVAIAPVIGDVMVAIAPALGQAVAKMVPQLASAIWNFIKGLVGLGPRTSDTTSAASKSEAKKSSFENYKESAPVTTKSSKGKSSTNALVNAGSSTAGIGFGNREQDLSIQSVDEYGNISERAVAVLPKDSKGNPIHIVADTEDDAYKQAEAYDVANPVAIQNTAEKTWVIFDRVTLMQNQMLDDKGKITEKGTSFFSKFGKGTIKLGTRFIGNAIFGKGAGLLANKAMGVTATLGGKLLGEGAAGAAKGLTKLLPGGGLLTKAGSAIGKGVAKVGKAIAKPISKGLKTAANALSDKATTSAIKLLEKGNDSIITKLLEKIGDFLKKLAGSGDTIAKAGAGTASKGIIKGISDFFGKLSNKISTCANNIKDKIVKKFTGTTAKTTAASSNVIGWIYYGVRIVGGALFGAYDAGTLFGVANSEASNGMRITSAIMGAILGLPIIGDIIDVLFFAAELFGWNLKMKMAEIIYEALCKVFKWESGMDELNQARNKAEVDRQTYNAINNSNLTAEEFAKVQNSGKIFGIGRDKGMKELDKVKDIMTKRGYNETDWYNMSEVERNDILTREGLTGDAGASKSGALGYGPAMLDTYLSKRANTTTAIRKFNADQKRVASVVTSLANKPNGADVSFNQKSIVSGVQDSMIGPSTTSKADEVKIGLLGQILTVLKDVAAMIQYNTVGNASLYTELNNYFANSMSTLFGIKKTTGKTYKPLTVDLKSAASKLKSTMSKYSRYGTAVGFGADNEYRQGDPRWGNMPLGRFPNGRVAKMKDAGCGPTAMAAVASQFGVNPGAIGFGSVTPSQMGVYAANSGYISDGGANAGLFTEGAAQMGLNSTPLSDAASLKANLMSGRPAILTGTSRNSASSPYSPAGHIVVADGIQGNKARILDPASGRHRMYDINAISKNTEYAWGYSRGYGRGALGYAPVNDDGTIDYSYYKNKTNTKKPVATTKKTNTTTSTTKTAPSTTSIGPANNVVSLNSAQGKYLQEMNRLISASETRRRTDRVANNEMSAADKAKIIDWANHLWAGSYENWDKAIDAARKMPSSGSTSYSKTAGNIGKYSTDVLTPLYKYLAGGINKKNPNHKEIVQTNGIIDTYINYYANQPDYAKPNTSSSSTTKKNSAATAIASSAEKTHIVYGLLIPDLTASYDFEESGIKLAGMKHAADEVRSAFGKEPLGMGKRVLGYAKTAIETAGGSMTQSDSDAYTNAKLLADDRNGFYRFDGKHGKSISLSKLAWGLSSQYFGGYGGVYGAIKIIRVKNGTIANPAFDGFTDDQINNIFGVAAYIGEMHGIDMSNGLSEAEMCCAIFNAIRAMYGICDALNYALNATETNLREIMGMADKETYLAIKNTLYKIDPAVEAAYQGATQDESHGIRNLQELEAFANGKSFFGRIKLIGLILKAKLNSFLGGGSFWEEFEKLTREEVGGSSTSTGLPMVTGMSKDVQQFIKNPANMAEEIYGTTLPLIYKWETGGNYAQVSVNDNGSSSIGIGQQNSENGASMLDALAGSSKIKFKNQKVFREAASYMRNHNYKLSEEMAEKLRNALADSGDAEEIKKIQDAVNLRMLHNNLTYSGHGMANLYDDTKIKDPRSISLISQMMQVGPGWIMGHTNSEGGLIKKNGKTTFYNSWSPVSKADELRAVRENLYSGILPELDNGEYWGGYKNRIDDSYETLRAYQWKNTLPAGQLVPLLNSNPAGFTFAADPEDNSDAALGNGRRVLGYGRRRVLGYDNPTLSGIFDTFSTTGNQYVDNVRSSTEDLNKVADATYSAADDQIYKITGFRLSEFGGSNSSGDDVTDGSGETVFTDAGNGSYSYQGPVVTSLKGTDRERYIAMAKSQIGYANKYNESDLKTFSANPTTAYGAANKYSMEMAGYTATPPSERHWCHDFASWVGRAAGIPESIVHKEAGCTTAVSNWGSQFFRVGTKKPQPGDIVYFDWDNSGDYDHVGIVSEVNADGSGGKTIEGNTNMPNGYTGVAEKTRSNWAANSVAGFARPNWTNVSQTVDPRDYLKKLGYGRQQSILKKSGLVMKRGKLISNPMQAGMNSPGTHSVVPKDDSWQNAAGYGTGSGGVSSLTGDLAKLEINTDSSSTDTRLEQIFELMAEWYASEQAARTQKVPMGYSNTNVTNVNNYNTNNTISTPKAAPAPRVNVQKSPYKERMIKQHMSLSTRKNPHG